MGKFLVKLSKDKYSVFGTVHIRFILHIKHAPINDYPKDHNSSDILPPTTSRRHCFAFHFIIKGWRRPLIIIHPLYTYTSISTNGGIMQSLRIKYSRGKEVSCSLSNQNGNRLRHLIIYIHKSLCPYPPPPCEAHPERKYWRSAVECR